MNNHIKRKRLLTSEPVQLKYLILMMFSMIVPLVIFGGALYLLILNIMTEQMGFPEYFAVNMIPAINKINIILLVGFPPLVLLIFIWGLILSHRFAGPLKRLENELEDIAATGDFKKRIKVRKHDDIRAIADAINKLLAKVSEGRGR